MKQAKNPATARRPSTPAPSAPAPIALSPFVLDDARIDENAGGYCVALGRIGDGENAPAPFRASLSIVADCVPFDLARVGGRWCLEFAMGSAFPASGPILAVEVGEGCALSFEDAAALVCGV